MSGWVDVIRKSLGWLSSPAEDAPVPMQLHLFLRSDYLEIEYRNNELELLERTDTFALDDRDVLYV